MSDFREFPKIFRLFREVIVTEKIDGTNACVVVEEDGSLAVQTRNRILGPEESDSFGFALWAHKNKNRLVGLLGPGHHFGEWWGKGIQRGYGKEVKKLSLFNVERWKDLPDSEDLCTVPVLYRGLLDTLKAKAVLLELSQTGSHAAPGFMRPEGIVVFHVQANLSFKVTLEKDEEHKGNRR